MPHSIHRIEAANVHFGEALHDEESMKLMFGSDPAVVALQEVWSQDREAAQAVADRYGYDLYAPQTSMDLVAAVRRGVEVVSTAEHAIDGRRLRLLKGMGTKARRRDSGMHGVTVQDPSTRWRMDVLNTHPVPPPLQLVTRREIWGAHGILEQHYSSPPDGTVRVLVRDGNHFPRPYRRDTEVLKKLGYEPLIEEGTPTCMVGNTHPILSRIMEACGIKDPQLDSAYIAVPGGYELVCGVDAERASTLIPRQIGVAVDLGRIASDHLRYGITLHLPE